MRKVAVLIAFLLLMALSSNAQPIWPISIYGKVLDENDNPVENETVTAEWMQNEALKTASAKTFTLEEANALGNPELAGAYIFQKKDIQEGYGHEITIKTQPRRVYTKIILDSEEIFYAPTIRIPGLSEKLRDNEKANISRKIFSLIILNIKWAFLKTYKIILAGAAILLGFKYFFNAYKKRKKNAFLYNTPLLNKISAFYRKKAKGSMIKKVVTVQKDAGILETLEIMITKNVNCIIAMDGRMPAGVVSECDFLKKIYTKDKIEPLKISSIMSSPIKHLEPNSRLSEVIEFSVKNKIRRVPIIKKDKLLGIVSISDILRDFLEFFSKNAIDYPSLPSVKEIMTKDVNEINDEAKLSDVIGYMVLKNSGYAMVLGTSEQKAEERMITSGDMLNQFYKSLKEMYKLKLKQITTSPVIFVKGNASIIEAVEMMEKNSFRRLPVIEDNKVVGIVTQLALIKSIYDFTKSIQSTSNEK